MSFARRFYASLRPLSTHGQQLVRNYERELRVLSRAALGRELRDARSDRLLRRLLRDGGRLTETQIARLVGFYAHAMQERENALEAKLARDLRTVAETRRKWKQSILETGTDPALVVKVWRTAADEKVREAHANMDGVALPFDWLFVTEDGGNQWAPPYAYNCRCWVDVYVLDAPPKQRDDGTIILPKHLR